MESNSPIKPLPSIFIGREETINRVNRYLQNKHLQLSAAIQNNGIAKEETKSIWYSKEHVETWLDEINLMNADGIRVYFGEYGNQDGQFAGQLCLLVVPTRLNNETGRHEDIILEDEPEFTERLQAAQSRSFDPTNTPLNMNTKEKGYNYGAPCPPIC